MKKLIYLAVAAFFALGLAACNNELDPKLTNAPKISDVKTIPDVIGDRFHAAQPGEEVVISGTISSDYGPLYIYAYYMICPAEEADKLGNWYADDTQTNWSSAWSGYWSGATVYGPTDEGNSSLMQKWSGAVSNEPFRLTLPGQDAGTVVLAYVYTNNSYNTFANGYILYKVESGQNEEEVPAERPEE